MSVALVWLREGFEVTIVFVDYGGKPSRPGTT